MLLIINGGNDCNNSNIDNVKIMDLDMDGNRLGFKGFKIWLDYAFKLLKYSYY